MCSPPGQSWVCYLWEEWTGLVQFRFKVASLPLGGPWGTCCDQEACSTWKGGLRGPQLPTFRWFYKLTRVGVGGTGIPSSGPRVSVTHSRGVEGLQLSPAPLGLGYREEWVLSPHKP